MNLYKFGTVSVNSLSALIESSLYFASSKQLNDPTEGMFDIFSTIKKDDVGILSMAIGEASEIAESPFFWAHYGNELRGFCLVFHKECLINSLNAPSHKKVKYVHGRSFFGPYENQGVENVSGANLEQNYNWQALAHCLTQKPYDFWNEREYRFLKHSSGLKTYQKEDLVGILIGEKWSKMKWGFYFILLKNKDC